MPGGCATKAAQAAFGVGPGTNNGVEGCLISLQVNDSDGLFLWRFGVLLAADDGAHAMLPDLPIALPEAIAAVSG